MTPDRAVTSPSGRGSTPALVLSRMSSKRLPGKALAKIAGMTLVERVARRVRAAAQVDSTIVLTSTDSSDDLLVEECHSVGLPVIRGPLADVAERVLRCSLDLGVQAVVRVSGDSPFIDASIIDRALDTWQRLGSDLVTNVYPRTFPRGQSVEVISTTALSRLLASSAVTADDREHVTSGFYKSPACWTIHSLAPSNVERAQLAGLDLLSVKLAVDSEEDLERARTLAVYLRESEVQEPTWVQLVRSYNHLFLSGAGLA